MHRTKKIIAVFLAAAWMPLAAIARPTVVELFTSQGCSSCPQAETLLRQLSQDPALLALSFHVHYFDQGGWKDPFSSEANTARQKAYVGALGLDSVFTPQMIVDGVASVIGSDDRAVEASITAAENNTVEIPVSITPQADGNLRISIGGSKSTDTVPADAAAWELHFNRGGFNSVDAGDNGGQILESTNTVRRYVPMNLVAGRQNDYILPGNFPEDGVAILLQQKPLGRILGAAFYLRPATGAAGTGQRAEAR